MIAARLVGLSIGVAILACIGACADPPRVLNIPVAPVRTDKDLVTEADVKQAIARAGSGLGWSLEDKGAGKLVATKTEKDRAATVDIGYHMSMYSIRYRDSRNLNYRYRPLRDATGAVHDPEHATIDKIYNEWVQALDQAVQRELAGMR